MSFKSYYIKCRLLKFQRFIKNKITTSKSTHTHLFILSPYYGGSTLFHELLSTSPNVSPNNIHGTREGLALPEVLSIIDYKSLWNNNYHLNWPEIHTIWKQYWDLSKPILLDKSPSNLLHAHMINEYFENAKFIITTRNPYAHCESLIRRNNLSIEESTDYVLKYLTWQKHNCETLNNRLQVSYEELVNDTFATIEKIVQFIPMIRRLNPDKKFMAHNRYHKKSKMVNMNLIGLNNLSIDDKIKISNILRPHERLITFFNYSIE